MSKTDFSAFYAFEKKLERLAANDLAPLFEKMAKGLAARLITLAKKRTPVWSGSNQKSYIDALDIWDDEKEAIWQEHWQGRSGGTLRHGWTAKTEEEAAQASGPGQDPVVFAQSLRVSKGGGAYSVEVVNPVHYASYVEYGHRQNPGRYVPAIGVRLVNGWVPGRLMLTISEQELRNAAPKILEKMLLKFLEGAFGGQ
jgi:hypothetical protein